MTNGHYTEPAAPRTARRAPEQPSPQQMGRNTDEALHASPNTDAVENALKNGSARQAVSRSKRGGPEEVRMRGNLRGAGDRPQSLHRDLVSRGGPSQPHDETKHKTARGERTSNAGAGHPNYVRR